MTDKTWIVRVSYPLIAELSTVTGEVWVSLPLGGIAHFPLGLPQMIACLQENDDELTDAVIGGATFHVRHSDVDGFTAY